MPKLGSAAATDGPRHEPRILVAKAAEMASGRSLSPPPANMRSLPTVYQNPLSESQTAYFK
ncbi:hypothetical protein IAQ61_007741 [Plenodomus lingam]|uniref:Predicted protein n=1 Tax=Leptosphaeria maculans (strain JN3 / isolate v23.1.3 / race Av1-4-5-6-7-8) TaxID=985895 RepID=E5A4T7_LEPMJ|nr:predicted protein [Plenodomus lingam JN3]KAH9867149.1 hypothetical protein IAQ61_007741 [Plenodomus lingam]CBX98635.1 predicted protein [Plenodomus lingam JN3]